MYYGLKWFKIILKWHQTFRQQTNWTLANIWELQETPKENSNIAMALMRWHMDFHQHGPKNACVPSHSGRLQRLESPGSKWADVKESTSTGSWCEFSYTKKIKNNGRPISLVGVCWLRCWLYLSRNSCATFMFSKFSRNISNSALLAAPVTFLPSHSSASCVSRPLPPLEAVQERPLHGNAWCLSRAYIT